MRASVLAAAVAFAASAIAVPMEKRDYVKTDYHVFYTTEYVTVVAGHHKPTPSPAPAPAQNWGGHWGHHWWGHKPNKGHTTQVHTTPIATWAPTPTKAPSSPSPEPAPASGYSGVVVQQHNYHRQNHSAPDIEWDSGLASIAASIAATCVYAHNTDMGGGGYGQNIAAGVDDSGIGRIITDMFYNGEVNYYNGLYGQAQPSMSNFEHWGHFSQVVWKATTHVGCATQHCSGGLANTGGNVPPYFTVCNYKSPGNFANQYGANVGRPLGHPTITA